MGNISDLVYPELITAQPLSSTSDNFLIWKLKLSFVLADHQFPHLMEPSPPPQPTTGNEENEVAKQLILRTLGGRLYKEFEGHPTAASIIDGLLTRFKRHWKNSSVYRFKEYRSCRMAKDAHISSHILRMRAIVKEIECRGGIEISDELQGFILLNSLPEDWAEEVEGLLRELDKGEVDWSFINFSRRLMAINDVKKMRKFNLEEKLKKMVISPDYSYDERQVCNSDCPDPGSLKLDSILHIFLVLSDHDDIDDMFISERSYLEMKCQRRLNSKGSNFPSWKSEILGHLQSNKVIYVLKEPEPEPNSSSSEDAKWKADDLTCRHLILGTVEDDVFLSFHDYPTAKALMGALEAFFNSASAAKKLVRLKKYMSKCMAEETEIEDHIYKMDRMVLKLKNRAGMAIPSEMQSGFLLDSLPPSYVVSIPKMFGFGKENPWSIENVKERLTNFGQDH